MEQCISKAIDNWKFLFLRLLSDLNFCLIFRNMCIIGYNSGKGIILVLFLFWHSISTCLFMCFVNSLFQLWLVLHICTRICVSFSDLPPRLHHQANGEPMEDLCEAICCAYGFPWSYQRLPGFSQLSCTAHVQINKGKQKIP